VRPDRLWGPPSLLYSGYRRAFPGGKARPGREADHLSPFQYRDKEDVGAVAGPLYPLLLLVVTATAGTCRASAVPKPSGWGTAPGKADTPCGAPSSLG
jgi:hypothetical protein